MAIDMVTVSSEVILPARKREVRHFDRAGKVPRGRQTRADRLERSSGTGEVRRTAEAKASE